MPFYWERNPDSPFVTLIRVTSNYLDPENYNLDHLKALAERENDGEMQVFKSELGQALRDPARLPGDELFESVEYGNGSDEAFLIWLWHELYGGEPFEAGVPSRGSRSRYRPLFASSTFLRTSSCSVRFQSHGSRAARRWRSAARSTDR